MEIVNKHETIVYGSFSSSTEDKNKNFSSNDMDTELIGINITPIITHDNRYPAHIGFPCQSIEIVTKNDTVFNFKIYVNNLNIDFDIIQICFNDHKMIPKTAFCKKDFQNFYLTKGIENKNVNILVYRLWRYMIRSPSICIIKKNTVLHPIYTITVGEINKFNILVDCPESSFMHFVKMTYYNSFIEGDNISMNIETNINKFKNKILKLFLSYN